MAASSSSSSALGRHRTGTGTHRAELGDSSKARQARSKDILDSLSSSSGARKGLSSASSTSRPHLASIASRGPVDSSRRSALSLPLSARTPSTREDAGTGRGITSARYLGSSTTRQLYQDDAADDAPSTANVMPSAPQQTRAQVAPVTGRYQKRPDKAKKPLHVLAGQHLRGQQYIQNRQWQLGGPLVRDDTSATAAAALDQAAAGTSTTSSSSSTSGVQLLQPHPPHTAPGGSGMLGSSGTAPPSSLNDARARHLRLSQSPKRDPGEKPGPTKSTNHLTLPAGMAGMRSVSESGDSDSLPPSPVVLRMGDKSVPSLSRGGPGPAPGDRQPNAEFSQALKTPPPPQQQVLQHPHLERGGQQAAAQHRREDGGSSAAVNARASPEMTGASPGAGTPSPPSHSSQHHGAPIRRLSSISPTTVPASDGGGFSPELPASVGLRTSSPGAGSAAGVAPSPLQKKNSLPEVGGRGTPTPPGGGAAAAAAATAADDRLSAGALLPPSAAEPRFLPTIVAVKQRPGTAGKRETGGGRDLQVQQSQHPPREHHFSSIVGVGYDVDSPSSAGSWGGFGGSVDSLGSLQQESPTEAPKQQPPVAVVPRLLLDASGGPPRRSSPHVHVHIEVEKSSPVEMQQSPSTHSVGSFSSRRSRQPLSSRSRPGTSQAHANGVAAPLTDRPLRQHSVSNSALDEMSAFASGEERPRTSSTARPSSSSQFLGTSPEAGSSSFLRLKDPSPSRHRSASFQARPLVRNRAPLEHFFLNFGPSCNSFERQANPADHVSESMRQYRSTPDGPVTGVGLFATSDFSSSDAAGGSMGGVGAGEEVQGDREVLDSMGNLPALSAAFFSRHGIQASGSVLQPHERKKDWWLEQGSPLEQQRRQEEQLKMLHQQMERGKGNSSGHPTAAAAASAAPGDDEEDREGDNSESVMDSEAAAIGSQDSDLSSVGSQTGGDARTDGTGAPASVSRGESHTRKGHVRVLSQEKDKTMATGSHHHLLPPNAGGPTGRQRSLSTSVVVVRRFDLDSSDEESLDSSQTGETQNAPPRQAPAPAPSSLLPNQQLENERWLRKLISDSRQMACEKKNKEEKSVTGTTASRSQGARTPRASTPGHASSKVQTRPFAFRTEARSARNRLMPVPILNEEELEYEAWKSSIFAAVRRWNDELLESQFGFSFVEPAAPSSMEAPSPSSSQPQTARPMSGGKGKNSSHGFGDEKNGDDHHSSSSSSNSKNIPPVE